MNLQDIANFIDLVNNPDKYAQVLKNLQDEQGRLNAAIETVGKASELDKLRKQVEKEREENKTTLENKVKDAEMRLDMKFKVAADAQKTADASQEVANKVLQEAQEKEKQAKELAASFEGRDKKLRQQEDLVAKQRDELAALVAEYNAKVDKLRSVMA
jgi:chromosome segregation ATPase